MHPSAWLKTTVAAAAVGAAIAIGGVAASAASQTVQIVASGTSGCTSLFCFVPSTANAASGDTITWSNGTGAPHTVTPCSAANCSGQGPGTGTDTWGSPGQISPSGTYQHTFAGSGTYFYFCAVHGYSVMHGEVIVAAAPPANTPESPVSALLIIAGGAGLGAALAAAARRRRRHPTNSSI